MHIHPTAPKLPHKLSFALVASGDGGVKKNQNNVNQDKGNNIPLNELDLINVDDTSTMVLVKVKEVDLISNMYCICRNEGFDDVKIYYVEGLWVWIQFNNAKSCEAFKPNEALQKVLTTIRVVSLSFIVDERMVWIEITGLPLCAWGLNAFNKVANVFGKIQFFDSDVDDNMSFGRYCIATKKPFAIAETVKVTIRGMNFDVNVKEIRTWNTTIENDLECSDSEGVHEDDHSYNMEENYNDVLDDFIEQVSNAIGSKPPGFETQIKEDVIPDVKPHELGDKKGTSNHEVSNNTCSKPHGFETQIKDDVIPDVKPHKVEDKRGTVNYVSSKMRKKKVSRSSKCSTSFGNFKSKDRKGFSFINEMNKMIEVGDALGYDVKGCKRSFRKMINGIGVPMVPNPLYIKDFIPISLIGVHYKIIAKILATRLSKVINSIISPEQYAFITGRQILNGPLILSEVINWASILVNGSPTLEFSLKRGLRQGDPLSPFFFIIVMEGLNIMLKDGLATNLFRGIKIGSPSLHLSPNLYSVGVSSNVASHMAEGTGCSSSFLPFSYLCLPIGLNMGRITNWTVLIDRFKARLSGWKANMLSSGGRLTLIKSVLGSLGGLGVGSLRTFNMSLLLKWRWRLLKHPLALWVKVVKSIHGDEAPINRGRALADLNTLLMDLSFVTLSNNVDLVSSSLSSDGIFLVSDVRKHIDDCMLLNFLPCTRWFKAISQKVNIFMWRLFLDRLPHRLNLSSRGLDIESIMCPLCNKHVESNAHEFFSYDITHGIWSLVQGWCDSKFLLLNSCEDWDVWTRSTETSDGLAAIRAQLNNLGKEIKKVNEKVYAAQEKDPGSFTLPCYIINVCFEKAFADLRASVSVMPFSTYLNLGLDELAHTKFTVELVDGTMKHPKGIAKNILVGIGKFVFLVDFIILDMHEDVNVPLILERQFLSTAHAKVNVFRRKITLRVKMDDPNITMEEYIKHGEENAYRNGQVYTWEAAAYVTINLTLEYRLTNPTRKITCDFKYFEKVFSAIAYNDALTSKLDLSEPTISPQHIDEFDKTSLSECDGEEQNFIYFNDLFPFNVIYPDDLSDKDNDDDKIDIKQSSGDNVINTDVGAYAQGSNKLLETSHDTSNKIFKQGISGLCSEECVCEMYSKECVCEMCLRNVSAKCVLRNVSAEYVCGKECVILRVLRDLILHHSLINNSASLSNKFRGFYFSFKFGISGLLHHVVTAIADRIRELLEYMDVHDNDASESSKPSWGKMHTFATMSTSRGK
uniref:Reverse transcriptase zinc-binding domain-containing protein n=1 Tax=Tanacetum cinerariifolium TaxID=118510 RepID=A0A6L2LIH5_TANCI|nr:hypothetical protein [Tanacetum cinerariifolium]